MGSAPRAAQGASPIFRASLVQTSAALRPFRSAFGSLSKGGYTPPLAPCYPRLRQVAFGMYMPRFNADVQKPTPKEEAPMNTQTTTVTPSTPFTQNLEKPQQRQTAKEIIAENVKSLIEQLEAGHSDALTAYLDAMSRFHNYSFGNILEIARQRPTATRVAGLYAWNQLGRKVKKGEKGIRILAPIIGIKRKRDEEAEKDITKQNTRVLVGFRNAYVFDVSQTEGAELPAMREVSGDVGENYDRLVSFIKQQGVELVFTEKIAPALGMSYGGCIAILPGQSKAETFATLVHELGHEMLHKAERRTTTTKTVRETEAEAIAFVVGKAVGLEAGTASADYINLYHGNASLLIESLEVIKDASAVILAALQPPTAVEAEMPDAELAKVA